MSLSSIATTKNRSNQLSYYVMNTARAFSRLPSFDRRRKNRIFREKINIIFSSCVIVLCYRTIHSHFSLAITMGINHSVIIFLRVALPFANVAREGNFFHQFSSFAFEHTQIVGHVCNEINDRNRIKNCAQNQRIFFIAIT